MKSLRRRYFIPDWLISKPCYTPYCRNWKQNQTFISYSWADPLETSYFRRKLYGNNVLFQCMCLRADLSLDTSLLNYSFCWLCSVLDAILLSEIKTIVLFLSIKRYKIVFTICFYSFTPRALNHVKQYWHRTHKSLVFCLLTWFAVIMSLSFVGLSTGRALFVNKMD